VQGDSLRISRKRIIRVIVKQIRPAIKEMSMLKLFERSWKGEASLAAAFWLVYFVFSIIIGFIIAFIFAMMVPNFSNPEIYVQYTPLIKAILFPYTLFSAICVWRCAKNSWILWNVLARIIIVLAILGGIYALLQVLHIM
jgi:hypothetical protein